jgi:DNA-binding Xre family transcriptional regulator
MDYSTVSLSTPSTITPPPWPRYRSELALRAAVVERLRASGLAVMEQVSCAAGVADIVTADQTALLEIKHHLSFRALQQATGQLLLYRQCINPSARAIIVGYATPAIVTLRPTIEALGIEVICWNDGALEPWTEDAVAPAPARAPQTAALCWRVQDHALAHGLASIRDLSFRARISRQNLYPLWRGTARSVSLEMLTSLCRALDANPGGWFRWERDELVWRIREAGEAKGMTQHDLGWAAAILPHGLASIWHGRQQFVFIATLEKLARALEFDLGDLFAWRYE